MKKSMKRSRLLVLMIIVMALVCAMTLASCNVTGNNSNTPGGGEVTPPSGDGGNVTPPDSGEDITPPDEGEDITPPDSGEGDIDTPKYAKINVVGVKHGEITFAEGNYNVGDKVTINFVPAKGYEFKKDSLTVNGTSIACNSASYDIIIPALETNISCKFQKIEYDIAVGNVAHGQIKLSSNTATYGMPIYLEFIADEGYEYNEGDITITDAEGNNVEIIDRIFIMPASNITINADFSQMPSFAIKSESAHGDVVLSQSEAHPGTIIHINSILSDNGYIIDKDNLLLRYTIDGVPHEEKIENDSFKMPRAEATVVVAYNKISYNIVINAVGGKVNVSSKTASIDDIIKLEMVFDFGYEYKDGDITITDAIGTNIALESDSFKMPASNVTITANFSAIEKHPVTFKTMTGGSLSADAVDAMYLLGTKVTLTAHPDLGYALVPGSIKASYMADGVAQDITVTDDTFMMPRADVEVVASFVKIDYAITMGEMTHGSITVPASAQYGDLVTVETLADTGYRLDAISVVDSKNVAVEIVDGNSFVMPADAVVVTATFSPIPKYNISIDNMKYGTITTSKNSAQKGEIVEITAVTPIKGYEYVEGSLVMRVYKNGIMQSESPIQGSAFVMPESDVKLYAEFKKAAVKTYKINIDNTLYGKVEADFAVAPSGQLITLTATADEGYQLKAGSIAIKYADKVVTVEGNTFEMPEGNVTVVAEFVRQRYNITAEKTLNGHIDVVSSALYKDEVIITIVPDAGYRVVKGSLKIDGVKASSLKFNMPAHDVVISCTFEERPINVYSITASKVEGGYIDVPSSAAAGDVVTFNLVPNMGYKYVDGSLTMNGAPITGNTFEMPEGEVVLACTFEKEYYPITFKGTNGTITTDKETYAYGESVTLTVNPELGYTLVNNSIKANGTPVGLSFPMPAHAVEITCEFEKKAYDITTNTVHGKIQVQATATMGESVTFEILPNAGYKLVEGSVTMNGAPLKENSFVMGTENVELGATFVLIDYAINTKITNGKINVQKSAHMGDFVTFEIVPDAGYELVEGSVIIGGQPFDSSLNRFIMPNGETTIECTLKKIDYSIRVKNVTNGKIDIATTAQVGNIVDFVITPDTGYEVKSIKMNDTDITGKTSFTMPASQVMLEVTLDKIVYHITTKTTHGTINVKDTATIDERINIEVVPETGYRLVANSIKVNGKPIASNVFFMPSSDVEITCEFEQVQYTIKSKTTNGRINVKNKATYGEIVPFEIIANPGYEFVPGSVKVNGNTVADDSFEMPAGNAIVSCEFRKVTYAITTEVVGGSISSKSSASMGEEINLIIKPDTGYELVEGSVKVNGKAITGTKFTMPAEAVKITATFKKSVYTIEANVTNGKIEVQTTASYGDEVKIVVTPDAGYQLKPGSIKVNGFAVTGDTFSMPAENAVITCEFVAIPYNITYSATNGNIQGAKTAVLGESVTFNIVPSAGYQLKAGSLMIDGVASDKTTFTMPGHDVVISCEFEKIVYTINDSSTPIYPYTLSTNKVSLGDKINVTGSLPPEIAYSMTIGGMAYDINTPITTKYLANASGNSLDVKVTHVDNRVVGKVYNPDTYKIGTYKQSGMQAQIPRHPDNFGDDLIVEVKDGIYYVHITILDNTAVERLYWKKRKNTMAQDAVIIKNGLVTTYIYAFTSEQAHQKLDFLIGGGRMPFDPPFGFSIDFSKLTYDSPTIRTDIERKPPFLPTK